MRQSSATTSEVATEKVVALVAVFGGPLAGNMRHSTYNIRTTMVYVKVPVVYVSTRK